MSKTQDQPNAAWHTPLADAAPRVRRDDGHEPAITCAECRDIDRIAIEEHGIPGLHLMENAAIAATILAMDMLKNNSNKTVLIVAGGGNNAGDGFAMARGFHTLNIPVELALLKPPRTLTGDALTNYERLKELNLPQRDLTMHPEYLESMAAGKALIVDALLGTGFHGDLSPTYLEAIEKMNHSGVPILALDIPSGLNGDTGLPAGTAVRATRTITFAAVKKGLREKTAQPFVGELFVGDIGFTPKKE